MNQYWPAFILGTFLLFCITVPVLAQNNSNNEVSFSVSTNVISSIEIVTIQSMDLSGAETTNDRIQINPQNSSNAGKMIAIGNPNSDIRISFLQQRELSRVQGSGTLLFNYEVAGNNQDDQASAEPLNRENRDFELNQNGRFYLWIGGSVDISTAAPGNYEGEFTLDIEYI